MTRRRKRASILLLPIASVAALYVGAQDYFEAAAFVVRAAGMHGTLRMMAALESEEVTQSPVVIPWRGGELRGRLLPGDEQEEDRAEGVDVSGLGLRSAARLRTEVASDVARHLRIRHRRKA